MVLFWIMAVLLQFRYKALGHSSSLCETYVIPYGYPCFEYTVTTEDGYLVALNRIPFGINETMSNSLFRQPVLLQHGLLQGGDAWVLNPPDQSLGFVLADAGFDVWIGNGRGCYWSPGHTSLSKHDKQFWDWTWDELAAYDLPANIKFIHETTNSQVYYVGHSQGTIIGLAALTQPDVREIITAAALLSPITYLNHMSSKFLRVAVDMYIDRLVRTFGMREFNLYNDVGIRMVDTICKSKEVDCKNFLSAITGSNCCFNYSRIPYYLVNEPQSTSLKNLQHLAQMVRKGTFSKYDYGLIGNLLHYFQLSPPAYDISSIPTGFPLWMAYGGNDMLADPTDVNHTLMELQCQPSLVYLPNYGHIDFLLSTTSKEDMYNNMVKFFKDLNVLQAS